MCVVKTPKIQPSDPNTKPPEPTVIRNPYLDGIDPATKALRRGRSSLRIERAGSGPSGPPATDTPTPSPGPMLPPLLPALPRITPVRGGGGGGGGRFYAREVLSV